MLTLLAGISTVFDINYHCTSSTTGAIVDDLCTGTCRTDLPEETGIGGVGYEKVTSICDYMYQRLDGEASISCRG